MMAVVSFIKIKFQKKKKWEKKEDIFHFLKPGQNWINILVNKYISDITILIFFLLYKKSLLYIKYNTLSH